MRILEFIILSIHEYCALQVVKPYLNQLMKEAQSVRLWIQFSVPKIEDGNNFGVGIQEEVLSEASGIERDALTFLDQFTRYEYFLLLPFLLNKLTY